MQVRVIPAQMAAPAASSETIKRKLRVAAYCRVSTDLAEQENSFETQVTHYTEFIKSNPDWELAGVYADEGLSGGSTKKREQFNAMIADCENGRIDMVLAKSISRFARNTLDCIGYIRKLKDLNIPILFEKENILTTDSSGEMLITIMASLAQQESESISRNVRMGIHYRFQQGKPMTSNRLLGYRMSKDKDKLVIAPGDAVVARLIFREFLDGKTVPEIAEDFYLRGIKTISGKEKWSSTHIGYVLRNEKYMGDLLLQKTYIQDFMTRKSIRNDGKFPKYYVENAHDPIVPREIFMQVKGEFLKREQERAATGKRSIQRGRLSFSGKIVCGRCGSMYRRFHVEPEEQTTWRCQTRIKAGTPCHGRIVKETAAREAAVQALNDVRAYGPHLELLTRFIGGEKELERKLRELDIRQKEIKELVSQYAKSGVVPEGLESMLPAEESRGSAGDGIQAGTENSRSDEILTRVKVELDRMEKEKNELLAQRAVFVRQRVYARDLLEFIHNTAPGQKGKPLTFAEEVEQQLAKYPPKCTDVEDFYRRTSFRRHFGPVTEFDQMDVKQYIDRIVVYDESMKVVFKAGVGVEVRR